LAERSEAAVISESPEKFSRVLEEVKVCWRGTRSRPSKISRTYDVSLTRAKYAVEKIGAGPTVWPEAGFPVQVQSGKRTYQIKAGGLGL